MSAGAPRPVAFDEARIDAIFADLDQCHRPGAAVGVAIGGRPVYRKGFGLANLELPVVLSPTIRMRIASVSKQFVSLAYMLLCEEGKAQLDASIGQYLPELHAVTHEVTMRQLMGNISGLRDSHDLSCQFSGTSRNVSSQELLSLYAEVTDVNAAPGTTWIYNNGGFLVLGAAIERLTGQQLEQVLRERIFEPLGMYATLLRRSDSDFVADSAIAHMTTASGRYIRSNFWGLAWAGEGGIVSTVDDMLRWLAHMNEPVVGSHETWRLMRSPQVLVNGTSTGYGLGLICGQHRGAETLYHMGGGMGCSAHMVKVPAAALDVIVMVNREDAHALLLSERILDVCLPDLEPVTPRGTHAFPTGLFRSRTSSRVAELRTAHLEVRPWIQAGQAIASLDGRDITVAADADGVFRPTGMWKHLKLEITVFGDPADPTFIRVSDFGHVDDWMPVRNPRAVGMRGALGHYRSASTAVEASITATASGVQLCTTGRFGVAEFDLQQLAHCIWRARPTGPIPWGGGLVVFDDDQRAFRFWSNRTRGLLFERCA